MYGFRGFVVLKQIDQKVCLDENLIIQVIAHMIGMMMGNKPTDTFNLPVCITAQSYEQVTCDGRAFLLL